MTQTILIADDEVTVCEVIQRYLERDGFQVLVAHDGNTALDLIDTHQPDLLILDVMLPHVDGFAILQMLRDPRNSNHSAHLRQLPVIMLTARTEEQDRITGFELGTDDYVVKPFSPREVVMRVKALIRRSNAPTPKSEKPIQIDNIRIDIASRTVTRDQETISLTAKEFDLLLFLATHPQQVFTRAQLLDQVWGYQYVGDDSTVTVHIHRLREKLEDDPNKPRYLLTVWGVGYKLDWVG